MTSRRGTPVARAIGGNNLDVEGIRLVIVAHRSPGSPPQDLAEQRAILDSIRIEP